MSDLKMNPLEGEPIKLEFALTPDQIELLNVGCKWGDRYFLPFMFKRIEKEGVPTNIFKIIPFRDLTDEEFKRFVMEQRIF